MRSRCAQAIRTASQADPSVKGSTTPATRMQNPAHEAGRRLAGPHQGRFRRVFHHSEDIHAFLLEGVGLSVHEETRDSTVLSRGKRGRTEMANHLKTSENVVCPRRTEASCFGERLY